ncbi:MAG: hypothetical protein B6D39_04530 [Anaerolineae bacterium UTCFX2]|jgi:hypothetical protein|nr:hypothetical protein [Anaerolineae bacterium]MCZ7551796.1 hypothetical protein [Anaerolineales bacterium]OQY92585.1 MAG: hypothetical protein B6D39_04530 [Anaerolineae bacterium UTCFX2]
MSAENVEIIPADDWKPKALVIGGVIGAVVGVAATYLLIQRNEDDASPEISLGEGVKIGVLVLGLLRSIASL